MQTVTESTEQHPAQRDWAATVQSLEADLRQARGERDGLEKRRRGLLLPAMDSTEAAAELQAMTEALETTRQRIYYLEELISQARAAAVEQRATRRAAAIADMAAMLAELLAERDRLVKKARQSDEPGALRAAYLKHRQWFALATDLAAAKGQRGPIWH